MTLPEAMWIVCQLRHGAKMLLDIQLTAYLIVADAFPVTGYETDEDDREPYAKVYWNADYGLLMTG